MPTEPLRHPFSGPGRYYVKPSPTIITGLPPTEVLLCMEDKYEAASFKSKSKQEAKLVAMKSCLQEILSLQRSACRLSKLRHPVITARRGSLACTSPA